MKTCLGLLLLAFVTFRLQAQAPRAFNYQAVIRDAGGAILPNQTVFTRFSIRQDSANGTIVYAESHGLNTNAWGVCTAAIGTGSALLGNFQSVAWGSRPFYLQTEVNLGTGYQNLGASQLLSVPYALYAATTDPSDDYDRDSLNEIQTLSFNAGNLSLSPYGGSVNLSGLSDNLGNHIAYQTIYSDTNNAHDLGTVTGSFRNCYLDGKIFLDDSVFMDNKGSDNAFLGENAGLANSTGSNNCYVGSHAGFSSVTSSNCTYLGANAGYASTTGLNNTGIGSRALYLNSSGGSNTAMGFEALRNNIQNSNTAMGYQTLTSNTLGTENTASGTQSMYLNTTGSYNTSMGEKALYSSLNTNQSTAVGHQALVGSTGSCNTAVGANAMYSIQSGSYNTALGFQADATQVSFTNSMALGNSASVNASNKVRIGNASVTVIEGQVAWSFPSDARFKYDIHDQVPGLDFITRLHPVTYHFDGRTYESHLLQNLSPAEREERMKAADFSQSNAICHTGFLAQEVEKACSDLGYAFDGLHVPDASNPTDHYSIAYSQFIMPLVKAVQEQQAEIETLKREIEALKSR